MSMDVPMSAPAPAEGEAQAQETQAEALDGESEAKAAMAVLALSDALPPCDGFAVKPGADGALVIECSGGEGDGMAYTISPAALEAAAAELATED